MASIEVNTEINDSQVMRSLNSLAEFLKTDFAKPYIEECEQQISNVLFNLYGERSQMRKAPDGASWDKLSLRRIHERQKLQNWPRSDDDDKIAYLWFTGHMFDTASRVKISSEDNVIEITSNQEDYAELQEKGGINEEGKVVPARPWLFDMEYDREAAGQINAILSDAFRRAVDDAIERAYGGVTTDSVKDVLNIARKATITSGVRSFAAERVFQKVFGHKKKDKKSKKPTVSRRKAR